MTEARETSAGHGRFVTTRWSLVLAAARPDAIRAEDALARLCRAYWFPLYAYVRRRGYGPEDAQDMTQAFFAKLLERRWVADADRERGRFRTFLLTAISRFLTGEWDKAQAAKRGGGVTHVPIQLDDAEERYGHDPADTRTPEQDYDRRWALTLLETALRRLREEHEAEGRAALFHALRPSLVGERDAQPYAALAEQLGTTEGAARVAVHRLRKGYRRLLRDEIAQTMSPGADVNAELRHLFTALSGR